MCWKCGTVIPESEAVSRTAVCPSCGMDVKSCKNCVFYEPGAHYDCHETVDDPVSDKERANFCGCFKLSVAAKGAEKTNSAQVAKKAFENLFGA